MSHPYRRFVDDLVALERVARSGPARPLDEVRLRAPLPRPGKILACIAFLAGSWPAWFWRQLPGQSGC